MRTVFVMFDSLSRRSLGCYGGTILTPNFDRFAEKSVTFENHYVGSLPCMPARRDLHTGRLNFLHRSWGPLEPFDVSFPQILAGSGIHTHLQTDHYHYLEDGGATYHTRYSTWDCVRGQEWDPCIPLVDPPLDEFRTAYHPLQFDDRPKAMGGSGRLQSMINRRFMSAEEDYSLVQCFRKAIQFLDLNRQSGDWLLHLECFDPHEPFAAPAKYRALYPHGYNGPILDWPPYRKVEESANEVSAIRANYAALVSMCDCYFGKLLDYFDEHRLWDDTALILTTDHGYMLGEHDWWAKNRMPFYQEVAHIPLLVYHPDFRKNAGERRKSLTQTPDVMPTLLDIHGLAKPATVTGQSLLPLLADDRSRRQAMIYGMFGGATNVVDGRYTYFRYPKDIKNQNLWEYTLMPMHAYSFFAPSEFEDASLVRSFAFLRGYPVLKLPARMDARRIPIPSGGFEDAHTALYDIQTDPGQRIPLHEPATESRLAGEMVALMRGSEAPSEAFERLDLPID